MKLKRTISYNSNVNFDCHYSDAYTSGTIHVKQQTGEFNRAQAAINLLKIKFPQYDFGPDLTDFDENEAGTLEQTNTYTDKILYRGDYYDNVTFDKLKTEYDEANQDLIIDTFLRAGSLYEFCGPQLANRIIKDGNAKEILETFTRAIKDKEEVIEGIDVDSDISKVYLANKAIANLLDMPDLYSNVEEVTIKGPDGKESTAVFVQDEDEQKWSSSFDYDNVGNTLTSKKSMLDMQVFVFLTGQQTFRSNDFRYKYNNGEIEGFKMTSIGNYSVYNWFSEEEATQLIPLITKDMSEKIKNIDINRYKEVLKNTGLHESMLENAVSNLENLKALVENAPIASNENELQQNTENTTTIIEDNALNKIGLRRYSNMGFMYDIQSRDYEKKGLENASLFNKHDIPAKTTYFLDMDKETKELADKIKKHTRSFGFIKLDNSDSYKSIINALNEFEKNGDKDLVIQLCDSYEKSHISPRTADGKERLKNISELKNKFEILRTEDRLFNIEQTYNNPKANMSNKEDAKKEEIKATFDKLSLLSKKNPEINVAMLSLFYNDHETTTAPDILGMEYDSEKYKEAAARILIHTMIKEEVDKPNPDFTKINDMMSNPAGLIETLKNTNTVDNLFDEDDKFIGEEQFMRSTKELLSYAKENDRIFSDHALLVTKAYNTDVAIKKSSEEKANKEEEDKQIKELVNYQKVKEEDENAVEQAIKEANNIPNAYKDKKKIVEAYRKNKEIKLEQYKEKYGMDYQSKENIMTND